MAIAEPLAVRPVAYPHQWAAASWLAERQRGLLAMAPGLGKTATALFAMQRREMRRVLVVAPLTLINVWKQETAKWWPEALVCTPDATPETVSREQPVIWTITYDRLRRLVLERGRPDNALLLRWRRTLDLVLFDESVLLNNRKALRTRAAAATCQAIRHSWLLSGSPTTRFYDDLWAQLNALDPKRFRSYWRFTERYCLLGPHTVWSMQRPIVANVPGVEPTLRRDLHDVFYTYSYSDLARDYPEQAIPDWDIETIKIPLPLSWWTSYKQMQKHFVADLPEAGQITAPNVLVRLTRCMQLASHPALLGGPWTSGGKTSAVHGLLQRIPGPVIIWTYYVGTAEYLGRTLDAPVLIGETSASARAQIVKSFQAGEYPVLVAHPGVARFGITLTAARSAIYVERGYDGDAYYQSLHRIRRLGTSEPPRVVKLVATGPDGQPTVDHVVDSVLDERAQMARVLTTAGVREILDA